MLPILCYAFLLIFSIDNLANKDVLLFSYFTGNGEDGLHLAYSYDGYEWQALKNNTTFLPPTVGKDKLMRDPCIIQGPDDKFHMVWTISWKEKGIGYANSTDLIHWSGQQLIPVMIHEEDARNCWAPEIFYDIKKEQYIIFWSTTIPGRFADTDDSGDDGYNHRMYYITTKDFINFSKTQLFYEPGFNIIDGTIIEHDGTYYLFLKDETRFPVQKNIRISTSSSLYNGYGKPSEPITGKYWAEGPTVIKINNEWIVYFDKYLKQRMGALRSSDLFHWTDISDEIVFPDGTRHGTIFRVTQDILDRLLEE
jgi:hypothetical protein